MRTFYCGAPGSSSIPERWFDQRHRPPSSQVPTLTMRIANIADLVPPYGLNGRKTTGIIDPGGGAAPTALVSGHNGPAQQLIQQSPERQHPGMDARLQNHVEAHAVALMIQGSVHNATLYINRVPCEYPHPLHGTPWGCSGALERMLLPGGTLTVYGPNGYVRVFTGVS